jgi:hypothetical protein
VIFLDPPLTLITALRTTGSSAETARTPSSQPQPGGHRQERLLTNFGFRPLRSTLYIDGKEGPDPIDPPQCHPTRTGHDFRDRSRFPGQVTDPSHFIPASPGVRRRPRPLCPQGPHALERCGGERGGRPQGRGRGERAKSPPRDRSETTPRTGHGILSPLPPPPPPPLRLVYSYPAVEHTWLEF